MPYPVGFGTASLVTEKIVAMTAVGPRTSDAMVHEADCVIFATGFKTSDFMFPMEITGAGGRSLRDTWASGAKAHLGITVPGYPSMFLMYGPNTNTSGGSILFFLEAQARYLRQALEFVSGKGAAAVDVDAQAQEVSAAEVQDRFAGTAWTRCDSWYRDRTGRIIANWPGYMYEYARATRTFNPGEYRLYPGPAPAGSPAPVGSPVPADG